MRHVVPVMAALAAVAFAMQGPTPERIPRKTDEFQQSVAAMLAQHGVPGAGIALVRHDRVEWEGGVGLADRDQQTPVTAHTGFRVGSISKTFVAMAVVQLSEESLLDLHAPLGELLPDLPLDNPWETTDPVTPLHLLEHTAGFDDMRLNEMYMPPAAREPSLQEALAINPGSRQVRWRPGSRMSYSNHGYGVAGLLIEEVTGQQFDEYIQREIFDPLEMHESRFRISPDDEPRLARGYRNRTGPAVGYPGIYLRPAGSMHSSAHDMGKFVRMLLGWGELGDAFVIDPEYLGNMEQPRTSLAAAAGLRNGYGSGLFARVDLPYRMIGHDGGIEGFVSSFGYSPSRDAGYVVLLNAAHPAAGEALRGIVSMAVQYLKRDVEAPDPPQITLDGHVLDGYAGYYHDANPRHQLAWGIQWLFSGLTVWREADHMYARPLFGSAERLVPVAGATFRLAHEIDASRVFTEDEAGRMVLTGMGLYAERQPRWRVELVRVPVLATLPLLASVFAVAVLWVARLGRATPRGFWELKIALLLCPLAVVAPFAALATRPLTEWGTANVATATVFVATLALPVLALTVALFTWMAMREGASRALVTYAGLVAVAMGVLSLYLSAHDLLGVRLWAY